MSGYDRERLLWRAALVIERRLARRVDRSGSKEEAVYATELWLDAVRRLSRRRAAYLRARLATRGVSAARQQVLWQAHRQRPGHQTVGAREERRRLRQEWKRTKGAA